MNNRKYVMALALMPLVASATTDFIPHAQVRYEHNTNIFAANEDNPFQDTSGRLHLDDQYVTYGAGLDINHLWRQNRAYLTSDYRRFNYQDFTQLDRNEYVLVAGTELTVTRRLTAGATAKYEQQQVPFSEVAIANAGSTVQPSYTRINHLYGVSGGYLLTPYWQVNANLNYGQTSLPGYKVKETPWHADIKYLGRGKFTSSLVVEGDSGKYEGDSITGQPKFHQTNVQLTADYKLGGRTSVSGAIGRSSRSQPGFKLTGTTGAFSFNQQLTAKTNYYVQYTRTVSGYLTTQGAQLDQTVQAGMNWAPRPRLALTANYAYSKSRVDGIFNNAGLFDSRNDQTHSYGGSLSYEVTRWMKASPYYRHQQRSSTLHDFNFSGNLYGLELTARFQ